MEEAPSNAVLEAKLDAMNEVILSHQRTNHESQTQILQQCLKTNGRVTSLEKTKNMLVGGFIFVNVFIVPIAVAMILNYLK